jgi:hypothetical protein
MLHVLWRRMHIYNQVHSFGFKALNWIVLFHRTLWLDFHWTKVPWLPGKAKIRTYTCVLCRLGWDRINENMHGCRHNLNHFWIKKDPESCPPRQLYSRPQLKIFFTVLKKHVYSLILQHSYTHRSLRTISYIGSMITWVLIRYIWSLL